MIYNLMSITASELEVIIHTIKLNVGQMNGRRNGWMCNCAIGNARLYRGAKLLNALNPGCPVSIHENEKSVRQRWKKVGTEKNSGKTVACKDVPKIA